MIETIAFFAGWNIIFLLGADFPPPLGFLRLTFLIFALDLILFLYLGYLLPKIGKIKTFSFNLLFFVAGGIAVSIITGDFENRVAQPEQKAFWVIAVTASGVLYGVTLWVINFWIKKRRIDN